MAEPRIPDPLIERTLEAQVNESLATGGLYAAGLGFFAGVMLLAVGTYTGDPFFRMPYVFAFIGGVFSLVLRAVGKNQAMRGWVRYAVMLPFVSLPTLFFLGAPGADLRRGLLSWAPGRRRPHGPDLLRPGKLAIAVGFVIDKGWVAGRSAGRPSDRSLGCADRDEHGNRGSSARPARRGRHEHGRRCCAQRG